MRIPISIVAICILAGCSRQRENPNAKPSLTPVKVQRIELQPVGTETEYSANIAPDSQVNVAFRVGGYVDKLRQVGGRDIQEGDSVTNGTVLATLRQADFTNKVNQTNAQVAQARASLSVARGQLAEAQASSEAAEADFNRAKNLFATQSLTKSDYDAAVARSTAAKAKVDQAQAQIQAAEAQINGATQVVHDAELGQEDSSLKAPMSGIILKKSIETGSLAAPGTPVFVVASTNPVKAVFGIPDTAVSSLKIGQVLSVASEGAPGASLRGRISNILPSADQKSRGFDVEVTMPNPGGKLRPGMIANVKIPGGPAGEALMLPLNSVVRSRKNPDQYAVFVIESTGDQAVARLREVRLGKTLNNGISVLDGLQAGARVVTSGSTLISDGERVQVVP